MNNGGSLKYKCRRCGEIGGSVHVPNYLLALSSINTNGRTPREWGMQMGITDIHACGDGNLGISDLIGAELDKPKED